MIALKSIDASASSATAMIDSIQTRRNATQEETLSEERFPYAWYMVWAQSFYLSLFAFIENREQWKHPFRRRYFQPFPPDLHLSSHPSHSGHLRHYMVLSVVFVVGRAAGNIALKYIDYTTRVPFASRC